MVICKEGAKINVPSLLLSPGSSLENQCMNQKYNKAMFQLYSPLI
jgi:hypothetical protein